MITKIILANKITFEVDTIRESYSLVNNNTESSSQLTMYADCLENIGTIDHFKEMFTPENLATITVTVNGTTATFVNYTIIETLHRSISPNGMFHYEFRFLSSAPTPVTL